MSEDSVAKENENQSGNESSRDEEFPAQPAIVAEKGTIMTRPDNESGMSVKGASTPKPTPSMKSKKRRRKSTSSDSSAQRKSDSEDGHKRRKSKKSSKKKRRRRNTPTTSSSDSSDSDDSSSPKRKGKKFDLFEVKTQKDKNKWELPQELAHFYNKNSRAFINEKDLDELVKEEYPVPNNIRDIPKMDDFITSMWETTNKGYMPDKDKDFERIQNRIRDVMGPLGSVWNTIETYRSSLEAGVENTEPMDIDTMADSLQKSVMLLSQASNSVAYQRRVETLKSFVDAKAVRSILKQNTENFEKSKKDLFGADFKSVLKSAAKESKDAQIYFGQKTKKMAPKIKQPFRGSSFKRGDSSAGRGKPIFKRTSQSGSSSYNNGYNNSGKGTRKFLPQPGRTTKSTGKFNTCTPSVEKSFSVKKPIHFIRRKDKTLPTELGNVNNRQRSLKHCERLGNTSLNKTNSTQRTSPHSNDSGGILNSRLRSPFHVGKRSHKISNPKRGPNLKQYISPTQNNGGRSANYKPEGIKPVCAISTLQNGGFEGSKNHGTTRGFILQNRLKGCILYNTTGDKISEICEIQMEGKPLRIPLPGIWSGPSPTSFYKIIKNPNFYFTPHKYSSNNLFRRFTFNGGNSSGNKDCQRLNHFSLPSPGVCYKSEEICLDPANQNRIYGYHDRQQCYDLIPTRKESSIIDKTLSADIDFTTDNPQRTGFSNWKVESDSSSYSTSSPAVEVPTAGSDSKATLISMLRILSQLGQVMYNGIKMVDNQSNPVKRETNSPGPTTDDNPIRCSKNGGLGSHHREEIYRGQWNKKESQLHINIQELIAAELAIKTFTKKLNVNSIHIQIDNTTALAYLIKMGGTKNIEMITISKRIWTYLLSKGITLTAEWIPSSENHIADWESRNTQDSSEWKLCPRIFQCLSQRLGKTTVDLFASRTSHQLPQYVSWKPDPHCLFTDAFQKIWENCIPYAFPPFCLISRVLKKVNTDKVQKMILITPLWTTQTWYPLVLSMSTQNPLLLPTFPNLLVNPQGDCHPLIEKSNLQLVVWTISGIHSLRREYRRKLQISSQMLEGKGQELITNVPGRSGVSGAVEGMLIPLNVL